MRRYLLPREHGTYAQLTFPLLSGLLLGRPTLTTSALALTAVAIFLSYEPLAVLLGVRGARLQRAEQAAARLQLAALAPLAVLLGGVAVIGMPPAARLVALVPAGLGVLLLPLLLARRVKTLAGETLVAGALAGMHLPLAAAAGVTGIRLWGPAVVWFGGFFLATLAVHAIKTRLKNEAAPITKIAFASAVATLVAAVGLILAAPALRTLAAILIVPVLGVVVLSALRIHPRALRRVGWTLVGLDTATLALLLLL